MEITCAGRLKVAEALDETAIGSSKAWACRCSDTMKETKTVLEKLTRYRVYTNIYMRGITFGSNQKLRKSKVVTRDKHLNTGCYKR